jgi:hypothetical protein
MMANGHPAWCAGHSDGVHRSRPWPTAQRGDHPIELEVYLWRADLPAGPLIGIGLDFSTGGERDTFLLDLGQARILRHVLGRLLNLAGQEPGNRGHWRS